MQACILTVRDLHISDGEPAKFYVNATFRSNYANLFIINFAITHLSGASDIYFLVIIQAIDGKVNQYIEYQFENSLH